MILINIGQNGPKLDEIIFPQNHVLFQVLGSGKKVEPAADGPFDPVGALVIRADPDHTLHVSHKLIHRDVFARSVLEHVCIPQLLLIRRRERRFSATDQFPQTFLLFIGFLHVVLADDVIMISVQ